VTLLLQRQARLAAEQPDTAAKRVLDGLIEQELAAQGARSAGLDGDPRVVQGLQVAKRELLAKAYQDQLAERAVGPSSDEIDRYYAEHPALFSQRRLYVLQEAVVRGDAARLDQARRIVDAAKNPGALLEALRAAGLAPRSRLLVQAPEEMPAGIVEGLARLDVGQAMFVPVAAGARIFCIVHVQAAPVDKQTAQAPIEAFITSERKRQLVAQGMQTLHDKARIVYTGAFAAAAASGAARASN
jgi:EpsD family peptidyl-prolyl cis-trans isomerase